MAITHLNIEGFRSLKLVKWWPAALNVLIGPNGSGKSNLLRALRLLRSAADGSLSDAVISSGGMGALVWDSSARRVAWFVAMGANDFQYELAIDRIGAGAEYVISEERLWAERREPVIDRDDASAILGDREITVSPALTRETLLQFARYDAAVEAVGERLRTIAVYHDLNVSENAPLRQAAIARREMTLAPDGQNLIAVLHTLYSTNRGFKETLNNAMQTAFGREFEELMFPPAADQRIDMRIRWRSLRTEQSTASLSDGTLRFLMLVTILASPATGEVVAIDEPELGLHPHMLPIIAELAQQVSERTQVIFTTHSPQFLDAFTEPPTVTVVTSENGESKLEVRSGNDLTAWLERYTLGELFRSGELEAMV
jgi:predicted ATPase